MEFVLAKGSSTVYSPIIVIFYLNLQKMVNKTAVKLDELCLVYSCGDLIDCDSIRIHIVSSMKLNNEVLCIQ